MMLHKEVWKRLHRFFDWWLSDKWRYWEHSYIENYVHKTLYNVRVGSIVVIPLLLIVQLLRWLLS